MSELKDKQYLNSSNFRSRIFLHYKYSRNKYSWPLWVFDNISKPDSAKVLEIGCGNGLLWKVNEERIPGGWDITLTDFSKGMLQDAENIIGRGKSNIKYEVMNAESIQYEDNTFDIIFANHMMYHIRDRKKAISEIRRVLKTGGVFYATTMQKGYMKEMGNLVREFYKLPQVEDSSTIVIENFSLQNGEQQLKEYFEDVELKIYENSLIITDAGPLVEYATSLKDIAPGVELFIDKVKDQFTEFVQSKIENEGCINISADSGIFINRNTIIG